MKIIKRICQAKIAFNKQTKEGFSLREITVYTPGKLF